MVVVLEILNWKSVSINVRLMTHVFFKDDTKLKRISEMPKYSYDYF